MRRKILSIFIIILLILPSRTVSAHILNAQGSPIPFNPILIKGLKVHPNNPIKFNFIVDSGDSSLQQEVLKQESTKLIKYFLTALTIPEKDLWVNLSPDEPDRIIPDNFGKTVMGKDVLQQDYLLKQITASLMYPENKLGKRFWTKVYSKLYSNYKTTDLSINSLSRVWIVPDKVNIYEGKGRAFIVSSSLKVMLE